MKFFTPKEIIPSILEEYGITHENYMLFDIWEREFKNIADCVKLVGVKKDTIYIKPYSSIHSNEVRINEKEILKVINGYYGYEKFKKIKKLNK